MKKVYLLCILIISMTEMSAQDFDFGLRGGVNFASIGGDDVSGIDSRTSFQIGAIAEFPLSEKFSLQPELLYSSQGGESEESVFVEGVNVNTETTLKLDYLSFPVFAKYYIVDNLSFEAGPQLALLLDAEADIEATDGNNTVSDSVDISDDTKDIDFGLNFGFGYKLDNGLNFSARYYQGLTSLDEGDTDVFNQVIQLSVGFFF